MDKLINSKFSNTEVTNNVENVGLGECMTPLNSQNQFSKVCIDWFQCTVPMPRNFLSKVQDYDYSKLESDELTKIDKFELYQNDASQNFLLMLKYLNLDLNDALEHCLDTNVTDWGKIKTEIKDTLSDYLWKKTKRNPMILPIIMEV